ncbi:hypothetical protein MKR65_13155 [Acinetobacter baumannii]
MRRSITTQYTRDQAIIGTNVPYAPILHNGGQTRPHVIRPRNKQALSFNGKVFKQVNHPGSKFRHDHSCQWMNTDSYNKRQKMQC